MPTDLKRELGDERIPQRTWLKMPAVGMEAEFNVFLDESEINPEGYWKHPSAFIEVPMLRRTKKSSQLPTGGAVYFDRGVIEVVTPVIEIESGCASRAVRSLWEQIGFVRNQLTEWEHRSGHHVRLKGYSAHYNVSYEIPRSEQSSSRNLKRLALLLAYILPVPVALVATNRRSTGVGVRPRGNRIEITVDFTPDPGLMIAAAVLIVGITRAVMAWPSYRLSHLRELNIPTVTGVTPGKHTTRKGWLTRDFHFPQSPFACDIDAVIWRSRDGRLLSLRQMGLEVASHFRTSIRRIADPFSFRLLFALLEGRAPSMLELLDRPAAYEDVGRLCRWGSVLSELKSRQSELQLIEARNASWGGGSFGEYLENRERERTRFLTDLADRPHRRRSAHLRRVDADSTKSSSLLFEPPAPPRPRRKTAAPRRKKRARRMSDTGSLLPGRSVDYLDRRRLARPIFPERRRRERRARTVSILFPDRRLTRSAYEQVFLKLVSGARLRIGRESWTPVGMKGWYHAIFRRDSDGAERLLTIDQLLRKMNDWKR
ncbi:MAG TPA: hypothetical protein VMT00_11640 [Thermoanaerobaculia bacterium]|nr:hypothetical protein [Thermoanaerobaculia bacterium]